jgi:hypothetical protein
MWLALSASGATAGCRSGAVSASAEPPLSSVDLAYVDMPDGRALAFGAVPVVTFNLTEAQRRASRGARTRQEAVAEIYRRDDGSWGLSDPVKELDLVSDLAAAVLFAHAAVEGLGDQALERIDRRAPVGRMLAHLRDLRNELVRPSSGTGGVAIFGRLIRGDADTCAEDAVEIVRAVQPDLLPPGE